MKLAFLSTILNFPWGGADSLWTRTAEAALQRGDKIFLALSPETAQHARINSLCARGATLVRRTERAAMPSGRRRVRQSIRHLFGHQNLIDELASFQPNAVVLCQGGTFDFLVEPQLVKYLRGAAIHVVVICQANDDHSTLDDDSRKVAREFFSFCQAVVFVSRHNHQLAERQLAQSLPNAIVVQNPLPRALEPQPWPSGEVSRFAAVARLDCSTKGLDLLLPVLAGTLRRENSWELSIFGRGPDGGYLKELASHVGIADRLRLNGFIEDITTVWRDHHLMLLPSRVEGCSLAMMEAICCGRPVLATTVGGVSDWITDNENGFICAAPQEDMLKATLARAWHERARWPEMGRRGAEKAATLLDPAPELKVLARCARA